MARDRWVLSKNSDDYFWPKTQNTVHRIFAVDGISNDYNNTMRFAHRSYLKSDDYSAKTKLDHKAALAFLHL